MGGNGLGAVNIKDEDSRGSVDSVVELHEVRIVVTGEGGDSVSRRSGVSEREGPVTNEDVVFGEVDRGVGGSSSGVVNVNYFGCFSEGGGRALQKRDISGAVRLGLLADSGDGGVETGFIIILRVGPSGKSVGGVAMLKDGDSGSARDKLIQVLFADNVSGEDGGDGLEDNFQFTEVS